MSKSPLSCQRHLFDLPEDSVFLNTAYMGPQLRAASAAGVAALLAKGNPMSISGDDFFAPVIELRRLFAEVIHAPSLEDIAIIPAVSYGMAMVAKNLNLRAGDCIVTVADVFPSVHYAFAALAEQCGATMVHVNCEVDGDERPGVWMENLLSAIQENCRLVALPHVHWSDGTVFDLVALRQRCDEMGAWLVIDGTQSVGAFPFDVQTIRPDALVVGGYKWLLGAYGFGYMYVAPHLQAEQPIEENWINRANAQDFKHLTHYTPDYRPGAARYSVGEQSNFIAVAIARVSLQQILDWGVEEVSAYAGDLVDTHRAALTDMGWVLPKGDAFAPHLFGLRLSPKQALSLPRRLREDQVHVSYRGEFMRVSTHVTTRAADWEALMESLREAA